MSASIERHGNVLRHSWPIIGDDVQVHLTVFSRDPLNPDAYAPIADVVAAGDRLAEALEEIATRRNVGPQE